MIMPAAQKPHWNPCASRKACCIGCRSPGWPSPWIVVTVRACRAKCRHQAGMHRLAVEPHGACAAIAGVAALLDAERALVAQERPQALARLAVRR